jgi:uncharacterized protein YjbJ (UPF0337 family)
LRNQLRDRLFSGCPRECARGDQCKESAMNEDKAAGNWKIFKGKVKQQWGKLTDDDLDILEGNRDQLEGTIQKRYGIAKDEAQRQVREFRKAHADLYSD